MSTLNKAQKQAVEYVSGPLLIVAGAGTGKTTVITEKIAYLIKNNLAKPEEILALTFTDKTADEMQERADALIDVGYADLQISTFHSFCQKILEFYGLDIGLPNHFKPLSETDSWLMVRRNLSKFNLDYYRPLGTPARHIHELLTHFSKCKDELISPEDYLKLAEDKKMDKDNAEFAEGEAARLAEVANAYHTYNQLLLDKGALDFADLVFYTIKLLRARPNILKILQNRYKYILVDEFQDVNWAQYLLVQMLAGERKLLTVVGDDDQSIYAFRGASVSNIMRFKDDFPEAKEIVLTENYRSEQEILDYAYDLAQKNNPDRLEIKLKINKKLKSSKKAKKGTVSVLRGTTLDEEMRLVVEQIEQIKNTDAEAVWDDFAVLFRANSHAEPVINLLEKRGIPYEFLSASGLYRQPIIIDAVNFFRAITDHRESAAIFRLLDLPPFKFNALDISKILNFAKQKSISYFEALHRTKEIGLSESSLSLADKLLALITAGIGEARDAKPTIALYHFLENSGYLAYLTKAELAGDRSVIRQIYHLQQFFEEINSFETDNAGAKVADFLEHYEYILESGDRGTIKPVADTPDSVNLMTAHKAKGLEFKYVFVINMVEERFPARNRGEGIEMPAEFIKERLPEGNAHEQEERRLFYVAMTRAKEKLFLSYAEDYGGKRVKKPSRFLDDLGLIPKTVEDKPAKKILAGHAHPETEQAELVYELPKTFSFSQIHDYGDCPYRYKLGNILRIPSKGNAHLSFGNSMHQTFQEFYTRVQELNSVVQSSFFSQDKLGKKIFPASGDIKVPTLNELLKIYEKNWIPDWYENAEQREKYFVEGAAALKVFYESNAGHWTVPALLESKFAIKIGDYKITGRVDRIDQTPDGSLEIIDYKSGKAKSRLDSDDKDQLLIYQIAAEELPEYQNIGRPGKLTYYYVKENSAISFLGQDKDKEKLKEKLQAIIDRIHSKDFTADPEKVKCELCAFKNICEFRI